MNVAGYLTYDTKLDTSGLQKGATSIKTIVGALGIDKIISKAMGTISSSVGNAISRLDILNNYPKVIQNLGFSAKDAQKSINTLSDGLNGLPTALDDAASSVQRLVASNGDINKSTEYYLALNDAILAGGASSEIQEAAVEQLLQAYSKGKPEMQEWRSLLTAMPGQLKQVANAMGYVSTDDLYEALKNGEVSMEDFMDTLVKLDKNGGKNIKSFKEQAKDATSGISTSIANMKTAIARGVANIISSINTGLKKANLGDISKQIQNIGKTSENMLKTVANFIPKVIKHIANLLNVINKLLPVILGVVAGFVAYKTVLVSIQGIQIATKILNSVGAFISLAKEVRSVTEAMKVFNSVANSTALGIAIVGITGLISTLAILDSKNKEVESSTSKLNSTLEDYDKSLKELKEARDDYLNSNLAELEQTDTLYRELQLIVDENGKVKDGYEERAKYITGALSEALGIEINLTDNQIQNYQELKTSVEEAIKAKKAEILLNAYEEEYTNALKKKKELQEAYNKALQENKGVHAELNKAIAEYNEAVKNGSTNAVELGVKVGLLNQAVEKSDSTLQKAGSTLNNNQAIIANYDNALEAMANKNYDAVYKIYDDTVKFNEKTKEANDEKYNNERASLESQLQYLKDNKSKYDEDTYNSMVKSYEDQLALLKSEHEKANAELDSHNAAIAQKTLDGINKQLEIIKNKKYEFRDAGNGNVQLYIDGVAQGQPIAEKTASKLADGAIQKIKDKKMSAREAGEFLLDGVNLGLNQKSGTVYNTINKIGNNLLSRFKSSLKEHSPSKATQEMGINLMKGLAIGVDNEKDDVLSNIDDLGEDLLNRMSNAVNIETGKYSINGTSGSVSQILSSNATFDGVFNVEAKVQEGTLFEAQQRITKRKNLQTGFGG